MSNLYNENATPYCKDCNNDKELEGFYEEDGVPVCCRCASNNIDYRLPGLLEENEVLMETTSTVKVNFIKVAPKKEKQ